MTTCDVKVIQGRNEFEGFRPALIVLIEIHIDEVQDNKLYSSKSNSLLLCYPKVSSTIIILLRSPFLSILAPTESTQNSTIPPNQGRRTSGLSNDVMWTIIGSCTAVVVIAFSLL